MRPELTRMTTLIQSWWVKYWLRMMLQWLKLSQSSNLTWPWNHVHRPHLVNSLWKSEKEEQFLTAQGRPGKLFNHCKSWPWRDQMALHFLLHLPQDNSHSEWKNSGHSITCNKSRGWGRGVGRQRTELLRTYSCYKAISEKNWNIKN